VNEPTDALLLASIAGALDPGRDLELAEQLASRPALRARRDRLAAAVLPAAPEGPWQMPPVGAWGRTGASSITVQPMLSMEAGAAIRPGARLRIALPVEDAPDDALLVVLWRGNGPWQRILPGPGMGALPLSAVVTGAEATVQVVVQPGAAHQRWAVVVLPPGIVSDWTGDEEAVSSAVQQALADRKAAASVVAWDVRLPD
jgi:hypothetical protein